MLIALVFRGLKRSETMTIISSASMQAPLCGHILFGDDMSVSHSVEPFLFCVTSLNYYAVLGHGV